MSAEDHTARKRRIVTEFQKHIALNQEMGIALNGLGDGWAKMKMPYDSRFVGDPTTGVLHGGAVTALLDATAGAAAFMALDDLTSMATLDLRIDYLRPARAGETLLSHADCYRTTSTVAFLRCRAEHADGTLVATGAATFMIGTPMGIGGKP